MRGESGQDSESHRQGKLSPLATGMLEAHWYQSESQYEDSQPSSARCHPGLSADAGRPKVTSSSCW